MSDQAGHWITINGRHVLIGGDAQGGVKENHRPHNVTGSHPEGATIGGRAAADDAQTYATVQLYGDKSVHPSTPIPPVDPSAIRPRHRMMMI